MWKEIKNMISIFQAFLKDNIVCCILCWNPSSIWLKIYPYNFYDETYIFQ